MDERTKEEEAFARFVKDVADEVDRQQTRRRPLFHCEDGDFRLGDGLRIARRFATRDHVEHSLRLKEEHLARAQEAYDQDRRDFELLRPLWDENPTLTLAEVVRLYRQQNPGARAG